MDVLLAMCEDTLSTLITKSDKQELVDHLIDEFAIQTAAMTHEERIIFIESAFLDAYKTELEGNELGRLTHGTCKVVEEKLFEPPDKYNLSLTKEDINQLYPVIKDNKKILPEALYEKIYDAYKRLNNI